MKNVREAISSSVLRPGQTLRRQSLVPLAAMVLLGACGNDRDVQYKSGGMTHTIAQGNDVKIPEEFKKLIYPNSETTGAVLADGQQEQSKFLMLSCKSPIDDVSRWYQDQLRTEGWKVDKVETEPKMVQMSGEKEELEINVMISEEDGKTTVSISAGKSAEGAPEEVDADNFQPNKITPPTD